MSGFGMIKGMGVTLKHFVNTYLDEIRWRGKKYGNKASIANRTSSQADGIFTIQYPEEKMPVPENFRFLPFLVYEEGPGGEKNFRCTGCGICSKVCPPQCIWITRAVDPVTGKPVTASAEFAIDTDICMSCGFCAEFCPFDAIKMDHVYELANYDRMKTAIYDKDRLGKSAAYYARIRPTYYAEEEAAKAAKAAAKAGNA